MSESFAAQRVRREPFYFFLGGGLRRAYVVPAVFQFRDPSASAFLSARIKSIQHLAENDLSKPSYINRCVGQCRGGGGEEWSEAHEHFCLKHKL